MATKGLTTPRASPPRATAAMSPPVRHRAPAGCSSPPEGRRGDERGFDPAVFRRQEPRGRGCVPLERAPADGEARPAQLGRQHTRDMQMFRSGSERVARGEQRAPGRPGNDRAGSTSVRHRRALSIRLIGDWATGLYFATAWRRQTNRLRPFVVAAESGSASSVRRLIRPSRGRPTTSRTTTETGTANTWYRRPGRVHGAARPPVPQSRRGLQTSGTTTCPSCTGCR